MIEICDKQVNALNHLIWLTYKSFHFIGESKKLGDLFRITIGRTPPTKETQWFSNDPKECKWLSIKDMKNDGTFVFNASQFLTKGAIKKFKIPLVEKGDILLSFKLTLGRIAIAESAMATNEAIACFKVADNMRPYLFCFLKYYNFEKNMESTSSIGKAFNSTLLKELEIIYPVGGQLESFNMALYPLLNRILILEKMKIKLSNLKQQLLQKYF